MGIIRIIKRIIIGRDLTDGTVSNLGSTGVVHNQFDNNGPLETVFFEEKLNLHCGCFAPPGGRCRECGVISCIRCHQHCGGTENPSPLGCGKPLCREHCDYLTLENGRTIPYCKNCLSKITRKKLQQKAFRILLAPFVEMEGRSNGK